MIGIVPSFESCFIIYALVNIHTHYIRNPIYSNLLTNVVPWLRVAVSVSFLIITTGEVTGFLLHVKTIKERSGPVHKIH